MRNACCTSTNYKMSSKREGKGTCELNDENIEFLDLQGVTFLKGKHRSQLNNSVSENMTKVSDV